MTTASPLRRKIGGDGHAPPAPTPARVWRRAVVHGLSRALDLHAQVDTAEVTEIVPGDVAELAGDGALLALLDGPDGFGVAVLDAGLMAALIEWQTMGRVLSRPVIARPVTATDAAMAVDALDRILATQETLIADLPDLGVAAGYRYAERLDDPRRVTLRLGDVAHDRATLTLTLGGARAGVLDVILPRPAPRPVHPGAPSDWSGRLEARVLGAEAVLTARLAVVTMPFAAVTALRVGQVLALSRDAIGHVAVLAPDGSVVAEGRLGQSAGRKAVRLGSPPQIDAAMEEED